MNKQQLQQRLIAGLAEIPDNWALTPVAGKVPFLKGWQKAPQSKEAIKNYIRQGKTTGYGILTGDFSGLIALDIDGPAAMQELTRLQSEHKGTIPGTVSFTSGKKGRQQLLFSISQAQAEFIQSWGDFTHFAINCKGEGGNEQLDLRWNGCQSVLPPSHHPETGEYHWVYSPQDVPIAEIPDWLLLAFYEAKSPKPVPAKNTLPIQNYMPISLTTALSRLNRDALNGMGVGNRNGAMYALALDLIGCEAEFARLGQPASDRAYDIFLDACSRCAPGGGWGPGEWERIWKSAQKGTPQPAITRAAPDAVANCIQSAVRKSGGSMRSHPSNRLELSIDPNISRGVTVSLAETEPAEVDSRLQSDKIYRDLRRLEPLNFAYNEMLQEIVVGADRRPFSLENAKIDLIEDYGIITESGEEIVAKCALKLATKNTFNPIREYLESLPSSSNTSILDSVAQTYMGNSDPIHNTFVKRFLIAAVARIYEPGVKFEHSLVLQGPEALKKSTFFSILAGDKKYFDDSLGDLENKDSCLKLNRTWIAECSELENYTSRKGVAFIKAFLSSTNDKIRPPYGREVKDFPRRCVIVGTTNEDEFLPSTTGNRRFWVVPVRRQIDADALRRDRDTIWSAAVTAYKNGETYWGDDDLRHKSEALNQDYLTTDPWEEHITRFLEKRDKTTTSECLTELGLEIAKQTKREEMRVAGILRTLGWTRRTAMSGGRRVKLWERNPLTPPVPPDTTSKSEVVQAEIHSHKAIQNDVTTCTTFFSKKPTQMDVTKDEAESHSSTFFEKKVVSGGAGDENPQPIMDSDCTTSNSEVVSGGVGGAAPQNEWMTDESIQEIAGDLTLVGSPAEMAALLETYSSDEAREAMRAASKLLKGDERARVALLVAHAKKDFRGLMKCVSEQSAAFGQYVRIQPTPGTGIGMLKAWFINPKNGLIESDYFSKNDLTN